MQRSKQIKGEKKNTEKYFGTSTRLINRDRKRNSPNVGINRIIVDSILKTEDFFVTTIMSVRKKPNMQLSMLMKSEIKQSSTTEQNYQVLLSLGLVELANKYSIQLVNSYRLNIEKEEKKSMK